jgi:predicted metallopeptidase
LIFEKEQHIMNNTVSSVLQILVDILLVGGLAIVILEIAHIPSTLRGLLAFREELSDEERAEEKRFAELYNQLAKPSEDDITKWLEEAESNDA